MRILLDTNVLLRTAKQDHPLSQTAVDCIRVLSGGADDLCIVPQVLYEFWAVATRPEGQRGLGYTTAEAANLIYGLRRSFALLDHAGLVDQWQQLVIAMDVKGKPSHDARLVAAMQLLGIDALLTFNAADFRRFPTIRIIEPAKVLLNPPA